MQGEGSDLRGRALLVLAAAFACHMGLGFTYVFGPLQPDLTSELAVGRGEYAAVAQTRNYVVALTAPLVGLLVVRFGARPVLASSIGLLAAAAFLLSGVENLAGLLGATLLLGMGISGVGDITVGHAVSRWVVRSRGTALGILFTASNLGGMLLVPLIASMAAEESWRDALRYAGAATLVLLLPCSMLVLPPPATAADPADTDDAARASARDLDLRQALRTRSFWILVLAHLAYFSYVVAIVEHFVSFLMDRGLPHGEAAGFWGTAVGLGITSKLFFGFLSDRIPTRTGILIVFALLSLSSLTLLLAPAQPFLWFFVALFGFSYAARDVLTPLIVIECFGVRNMAKIYGAILPTLLVGGGAGSILAGICADTFGSYLPAFGGLAALNLLALALLTLLRHERSPLAA